MPRRGQIAKRDVLPDPLYNSKLVTRLINNVMYDGKKGVAHRVRRFRHHQRKDG
jgi:small subunit ribosomal protein S7